LVGLLRKENNLNMHKVFFYVCDKQRKFYLGKNYNIVQTKNLALPFNNFEDAIRKIGIGSYPNVQLVCIEMIEIKYTSFLFEPEVKNV
jgi:hypothetical protein